MALHTSVTRFRRGNSGVSSGTVDVSVAANADDGESVGGAFFAARNFVSVGQDDDTNVQELFARFLSVTVPQAATIDVAYITVEPQDGDLGDTSVLSNIYFEDADDAVAPTSNAEHAADVRTTAFTAWDNFDFTTDVPVNSPSIVDVIQEVVDRGSWTSGNAMMLLLDDDSTPNGTVHLYRFYSFEHATGDPIALHIEWST